MKLPGLIKIALLIICLYAAYSFRHEWLPFPGTFLSVPDKLEKSDCVIPLAGDNPLRAPKAAALYHEGWASKVIIPIEREAEVSAKPAGTFVFQVLGKPELTRRGYAEHIVKFLNIPGDHAIYFEADVTSTYEEALASLHIMQKYDYRSIILVTGPYHMRRTLMIFNHVYRGSGIAIRHVVAGSPRYQPETWWRKELDVKRVFLEYCSFVHNIIYRLLLKRGRTRFDSV